MASWPANLSTCSKLNGAPLINVSSVFLECVAGAGLGSSATIRGAKQTGRAARKAALNKVDRLAGLMDTYFMASSDLNAWRARAWDLRQQSAARNRQAEPLEKQLSIKWIG